MDTTFQNTQSIQTVLKYTYAIVPIVAGLDKFTNLLATWDSYLSPSIVKMLPFTPGTFMHIVGIIEIIAGTLVLLRPRIGGYVVMAWLVAIALILISGNHFFDVAVRDLVMAVGAYSLAKLSVVYINTGTVQGLRVQGSRLKVEGVQG